MTNRKKNFLAGDFSSVLTERKRPTKSFSDLPDDLIYEILSRLPIKYLLRLQSVSLLSDQWFIRLHNVNREGIPGNHVALVHNPENEFFYAIDGTASISKVSLSFLNDNGLLFHASSNGIMCFSTLNDLGILYICNPITRDFKQLRVPGFDDFDIYFVALAFNPSTWNFKLMVLGCPEADGDANDYFNIQFFDSVTNSWDHPNWMLEEDESVQVPSEAVYLDNHLYILTNKYLRALSVKDGTWSKFVLPHLPDACSFRLLTMEGLPCISVTMPEDIKLWFLSNITGKWILLDVIDMTKIDDTFQMLTPIAITDNVIFMWEPKFFFAYYRSSKEWTQMDGVGVETDEDTGELNFGAQSFRSTLFPCH